MQIMRRCVVFFAWNCVSLFTSAPHCALWNSIPRTYPSKSLRIPLQFATVPSDSKHQRRDHKQILNVPQTLFSNRPLLVFLCVTSMRTTTFTFRKLSVPTSRSRSANLVFRWWKTRTSVRHEKTKSVSRSLILIMSTDDRFLKFSFIH